MRNSNQIQMGRWKHYSKAIQAMVMRSTLEQYDPPLNLCVSQLFGFVMTVQRESKSVTNRSSRTSSL